MTKPAFIPAAKAVLAPVFGGDIYLTMPHSAVPHSFINNGDTVGRIICICQPGGFEQLFLDVVAEKLQVPGDIPRIVELAERYELEFLGPNPFGAK